ncbi:MAG: polyprenyl synthetase family protein [Endomicrobiales bacterium]
MTEELTRIYMPVQKELKLVEAELRGQVHRFVRENPAASKSIKHFFRSPGKYLRPVLVLLSSKAGVAGRPEQRTDGRITALAAAVEMMHSASLIHDDIIDEADERRSGESVNGKYGNHIAVLAGDILYAKAFSLLIRTKMDGIMEIMCRTTEKMCVGEINDLGESAEGLRKYLKVIEGKTASFMSACCESGALLAGADRKTTRALASYGYNFGMAYQLIDDYIDNDSALNRQKGPFNRLLGAYIRELKGNLEALEESSSRQSLYGLLRYVVGKCPGIDPLE